MNIQHVDTDQNWQDETTNIWYQVDGVQYAVSYTNGFDPKLLDCDGCPVDSCNDHENILDKLRSLSDREINSH